MAAIEMERGFQQWWDDADEEVVDRQLSVQGTIPAWLRGRLLRNGPGRWRSPDGSRTYEHAFDGLAKLVRRAQWTL
jgi:carotenoid cleavage dioxygenase-like enzyme